MAVYSYVLTKYISGVSKEDIELDVRQMEVGGVYEISNPLKAIASNMFAAIENFIHPKYDENFIRSLFDKSGKYKLIGYDESEYALVSSVIIGVDNEHKTYYYDLNGQFISREIYEIHRINADNVGYLVTEHIINPFKNCDLIEHCYVPYFTDIRFARQYRNKEMKDYDLEKGSPNSGFRITVVDTTKIVESDWYNLNLKVWSDVKKYALDRNAYRYIPSVKDALGAVLADAYDDLSETEQANVNYEIFNSLRDYIPEDYLVFLDEDIETAMPSELEEITDQAITVALVNASSDADIKTIHEILGPNEFRIGAITDDIYNANPDSGYIVVTFDGDMGWYPDCYSINEWSGAKGNPWYGKFQPNENDTLLCFKEYHPELIAEKLPKRSDIREYETKYREYLAEERKLHKEMTYEKNEDGDTICIGTWYCEGLLSTVKIDDAMFFNDYGSHVFTDDECRRLLNGEEIVIEHFITKMDMEITIRGMLRDVSTMFDNQRRIEFVRTDIDSSKRKKLNSEFGFEEPGLPPAMTAQGK